MNGNLTHNNGINSANTHYGQAPIYGIEVNQIPISINEKDGFIAK